MTAKRLAATLKKAGITVQNAVERTQKTDAEVTLTAGRSIQICDYPQADGGLQYILQQERQRMLYFQGEFRSLPALLNCLISLN